MIAILKKDGRYVPVVACDHCGVVIHDALAAMAVCSSAPEGATAQAFHVHKGECDQAVSAKLGGMHGSEELAVHLIDLVRNTLDKSDPLRVQNLLKWSQEEA
jgi:hypothetical protein